MSFIAKNLRRLYLFLNPTEKKSFFRRTAPDFTGQEASDKIFTFLKGSEPCMIARFGSNELESVVYYKLAKANRFGNYVKGRIDSLHISDSLLHRMENNAGFFPATEPSIFEFSKLMLQATQKVDVLGSWLEREMVLQEELKECTTIHLEDLNAFRHRNPWSKALEGKKVLVIHPFTESIQQQFGIREKLFQNPDVLPRFELLTYKPVQSFAGNYNQSGFSSWIEALQVMKEDISKIDFDIALIGCGAYGFPLAEYVKEIGRKSVHIGGATQLLFGIIGKRWEEEYDLSGIVNEHWTRPNLSERPDNFDKVEKGCYW